MGDFLLVHDESGRAYFQRLICVNILLCIIAVFVLVRFTVNIVASLFVALLGAVLTLFYVSYFIYKNPPIQPDEEES